MTLLPNWNDDVWVHLDMLARLTSTSTDTWKRRCKLGIVASKREGTHHNARIIVRLQDVRAWLDGLPDQAPARRFPGAPPKKGTATCPSRSHA